MVSAEGACAAYYAYGRHLNPQGAGKLHQIAPDLAPASAGAALVSGGRA
jgi:hydrogenase expression/formation protein HypD